MITATDSAAQQFETVFPSSFKAFDDLSADGDKNGRVSIWEAFDYASSAVHRWFEQHGQLPTERSLLDDNGDGSEAQGRLTGGPRGLLDQKAPGGLLEPKAPGLPPDQNAPGNPARMALARTVIWRRNRQAPATRIC